MTTASDGHVAEPAQITLVTAPNCHFCEQGREILDKLAGLYALDVHEVPLSSPTGRVLAARHGIVFPPGLLLDDSFIGFGRVSERKLRHVLDQRISAAAAHSGNGSRR